MKKYPNVALKVIFKYKDKMLILKHPSGIFSIPGGRMEWRESILEALNRELGEELNYLLKEEPALFSLYNYISKNKRRHSVMINFIHKLDKKPNFISPEKLKILWLTKKEILSKKIIKNKEFVDKIFNYKL